MSIHDTIILGIIGEHEQLGEGKTLRLTYYAKKIYNDMQKGLIPKKPLYSNYHLSFSLEISYVRDLFELEDCYVFFDDIIPQLDSRFSLTHTLTTWALNSCRKKKINLYYTAQIFMAIDTRLRTLSNLIVSTTVIKFPKFKITKLDNSGTVLKIPNEKNPSYIIYGKDILDLYNTFEIIYKKISLKELIDLYEELHNKTAFNTTTRVEYEMPYMLSETVYTLLKIQNYDRLKKILEGWNFKVST